MRIHSRGAVASQLETDFAGNEYSFRPLHAPRVWIGCSLCGIYFTLTASPNEQGRKRVQYQRGFTQHLQVATAVQQAIIINDRINVSCCLTVRRLRNTALDQRKKVL
jgi:hypothetical protein